MYKDPRLKDKLSGAGNTGAQRQYRAVSCLLINPTGTSTMDWFYNHNCSLKGVAGPVASFKQIIYVIALNA